MAVRVGINGFGRIGRFLTRLLAECEEVELAMINARADNESLAHLLTYDSVHGTFSRPVRPSERGFCIGADTAGGGEKEIQVTRCELGQWQWEKAGVDIVVETTGRVKDRDGLAKHLDCGAKKAIIGAPGTDVDLTVVMGVNDDLYDPAGHHILSNASCTTNCMAPVCKVLHDTFGIIHGQMTTIHSYTMSQRMLDGSHKDMRRARAAAMNIIPTTTGAAKAVTVVLPELEGRLDGMALRIPTPNVSLVDLVCEVEKKTTAQEVNAALQTAAQGPMKDKLGYSDKPLVSVDYTSSSYGGVVDSLLTRVMGATQVKTIIWYDNEGGYTSQLLRLIQKVAASL